uniref:non-specific serine/threonine protein kinase n=1 Tax=Fibrocapsa japonica TaxID=94617 RepID=A0A7S2V229_9STRA
MELISQGAEARVFALTLVGRPTVMKERFKKSYRLPELDEKLTSKRVLQEVRCLQRCRKSGVGCPLPLLVDTTRARIYMERVRGRTLKALLHQAAASQALSGREGSDAGTTPTAVNWQIPGNPATEEGLCWAGAVGRAVARLHDGQLVHGDLTTSNFMIRDEDSEVGEAGGTNADHDRRLVVIDFGLGSMQPLVEDKAVDLYVLERAFLSTHAGSEPLVEEVLQQYKATSKKSDSVLARLADVRKRGRKRECFG